VQRGGTRNAPARNPPPRGVRIPAVLDVATSRLLRGGGFVPRGRPKPCRGAPIFEQLRSLDRTGELHNALEESSYCCHHVLLKVTCQPQFG